MAGKTVKQSVEEQLRICKEIRASAFKAWAKTKPDTPHSESFNHAVAVFEGQIEAYENVLELMAEGATPSPKCHKCGEPASSRIRGSSPICGECFGKAMDEGATPSSQ